MGITGKFVGAALFLCAAASSAAATPGDGDSPDRLPEPPTEALRKIIDPLVKEATQDANICIKAKAAAVTKGGAVEVNGTVVRIAVTSACLPAFVGANREIWRKAEERGGGKPIGDLDEFSRLVFDLIVTKAIDPVSWRRALEDVGDQR